jgi:hypothetical protein
MKNLLLLGWKEKFMEIDAIKKQLQAMASDKTKKRYLSQGAKEPLYGLTIKALKPMAKVLKGLDNCQEIAYRLYDTNNYDLMYLAGMIVNPQKMSKDDFKGWLDKAYFYMITDYIVAVCLSETEISISLASEWIQSDNPLFKSAGYSTYSWMLANRPDDYFDNEDIRKKLYVIKDKIHRSKNPSKYAMYYFLYNVGVSYKPLHETVLKISKAIGDVSILQEDNKEKIYHPYDDIMKEVSKGRLGFKRKYVRC